MTLAGGETNNDVDFGYQAPVLLGSIGDRVWEDLNGDGVQDAGEAGINGVTVNLLDGSGTILASEVTSGDGNYTFSGLEEGIYTVAVDASTLPADLAQTFDADGLATANSATVPLAAGENRVDVDFGYGPCGACDGKVTELTLQYLGSTTATVEVVAKRGPTTDVVFSGVLNPGDTFEIEGPQTGNGGFIGTLGTEIRISVDGAENTTIHTSCSQPIGPGLVSGDFKVLAGASRHGGLLCPVDDPGDPTDDCGCEGKVSRLRLRYLGFSSADVAVVGQGGPNTETLFSGTVAPGGVFEVNSFTTATPGFEGTVGTEIEIFVNGVLQTTIHTSCSQPVGPGLISGDFLVVDGFSRNFPGPLCPVEGDSSEQCPIPAEADEFGAAGGHVFWLPGISEDLVFVGDTGRFTQFVDGTATMTGTLVDLNDSGKVFDVNVTFSGLTFVTPVGSPKKELAASAYVENGGPVDTDTWYYFTDYSGVLTGSGDWAGAQVTFTRTGPAFQVGNGASGKNVNFGASGWFDWTVNSQPSAGGSFPTTGVGDINTDLGTCPGGPGECVDFDFETDGNGNALHKGQIIDGEFSAFGITVTTNDPANHPAMIFDSSAPTGGDTDLGTPNQDFGGPGVGAGGRAGTAGENAASLGKVLIISEDRDQSDPDDNAGGGEIIFTFANPVFIGTVGILDIDEGWGGSIKAFDASNSLIKEVAMQDLGNNSVQTVSVNADGVSKLKVFFPGSGAISSLEVCGPGGGGPGGGGDCTPGDVP